MVEEAIQAANVLRTKGAATVIITMGKQGALLVDGNGHQMIPALPLKAKDTTAAGDAFAGALGAYWAMETPLKEAIRFANAAGAIAASRFGAQPSMGDLEEITSLLSEKS